MSQHLAPIGNDPIDDDPANPMLWHRVIWIGFIVMAVFFGGFGGWAALAPLGSGAVAIGQLQVDSNQKTIQHFEGGIIRRLHVREGDLAKKGQLLVELEVTRVRANLDRLRAQYQTRLAAEARLLAERDEADAISYPPELLEAADEPTVAEQIDGQRRLFAKRRAAFRSEDELLRRRIEKTEREIAAYEAQRGADKRQLALIEEEIGSVEMLVEKGLARKPRLLGLKRDQAELDGSVDQRAALIARAEATIAETEQQRINSREQRSSTMEEDLQRTRDSLSDLRGQLTAIDDELARTRINAPQGGRIHELRFHTEGGVVGSGEPILSIVPENDRLIVLVQLQPTDIDVVHLGAVASVWLTAFSQRTMQPLDGKLVHISADLITPTNGMPSHYQVRIELDPAGLADQPELELIQGMPAMAVVSTGDQTMLEYLLAPLLRSFDTALRED